MGKFADELAPKFADIERPAPADFKEGTIAWLIQRVMDDVAANPTTIRQFGTSALFTLKRLQREPIGNVLAAELGKKGGKHHIIEHCKQRRKGSETRQGVSAATTKGDMTALRGVVTHAMSTFPDCEDLSLDAFAKAKPFLVKNNLIGKSTPRNRRPTDEEIEALLTDLAESDAHPNTKIKMVPIVLFALASARRRGEIVRIKHGDVDYEKNIYWVRDVKHPTKKKGNDKCFTLWPELKVIIQAQPRISPNNHDELIFPVNGESLGKRYIDAKKRCGIVNLRFHDNRREAVSRWLLKLKSGDKVRKLVSGHDTEKVFNSVYDGRTTLEIMQDPAVSAELSR